MDPRVVSVDLVLQDSRVMVLGMAASLSNHHVEIVPVTQVYLARKLPRVSNVDHVPEAM